MTTKTCLHCYKPLEDNEINYHTECLQSLLGSTEITDETLEKFVHVSENPLFQDLTLHLAAAATMVVTPHALYPTPSGDLEMIYAPFDRDYKGTKLESATAREMLELEESHKGSYEQAASLIDNYSTINKLDVLNFWERVAFAWVVGANDYTMEDIVLYSPHKGMCTLAPICGMRSAARDQEVGLTLNRKSSRINRADFEKAMKTSGLKTRNVNQIFKKFDECYDKWCTLIDSSHIANESKEPLKSAIRRRLDYTNTIKEN